MRRFIARALSAFPFEGRSRRALDETLLDWEAEAESVRSDGPLVRTRVGCRSIVAFVRTQALATGREVLDLPKASFAGRLLLIVLPLSAVVAWEGFNPNPAAVPVRYWPELFAASMVGPAFAMLPLGLFYVAATWRPQREWAPAGAMLCGALTGLALYGLVPVALEHQRAVAFDLLMIERGFREPGPVGVVDRGTIDAIGSLFAAVFAPRRPPSITSLAMLLVVIGAMTTVWGSIGAFVRVMRSRLLKLIWLVAVPIAYVAPRVWSGYALWLGASWWPGGLVGSILIAVSALSVSVALPLVLLGLARRLATNQDTRRPVAPSPRRPVAPSPEPPEARSLKPEVRSPKPEARSPKPRSPAARYRAIRSSARSMIASICAFGAV